MRIRPDPHEPAPHRNGPLHATEIDAARALAERNPDVARLLDEHERHQSHAAQLAERFAEALARHGPTPTEPRERVAWIGALAEREPDIADAMRAGCAALEDADRSASQLAEALAARGRALLPWRPFTASC